MRAATLLGLFFLAFPFSLHATGEAPALRVLMVESYAALDPWTTDIQNTFCTYLTSRGIRANYDTCELSIRFQPGQVPAPADVEALSNKLASRHYDLIATSNNAAADLFLSGRLKKPEHTPLFIGAYSGDIEKSNAVPLELTGIELPQNVFDNLLFAAKLLPGTPQFVIVADSRTGAELRKEELQRRFSETGRTAEIILLEGGEYSTPAMLEALGTIHEKAVILFNSWGSPHDVVPQTSYTALPRIRMTCRNTFIVGKFYFHLAFGADAGILYRGSDLGRLAGEMTERIFGGAPVASIPITKLNAVPVLKHAAIKKYGIKRRNIPREVAVIDVPPSFWSKHFEAIIVFLVLFTGSAVYLFLFLMRRRRAFQAAQMLFSTLPSRVLVLNRKMQVLYHHIPDDPALSAELAKYQIKKEPINLDGLKPCYNQVKEVFHDGRVRKLEFAWRKCWRNAEFHLLPRKLFNEDAVLWVSSDVTALHEAHADAARLAVRFRLTLESIGDGVIATDETGAITLLNPVAARLTGYTPEEAMGLPLRTVFSVENSTTDLPVASSSEENAPAARLSNADLIAKDGTRRHITDSASPIYDEEGGIAGGVVVFRDVTALIRSEQRARDNFNLLQAIMDNMPGSIFTKDPENDFRFVFCNKTFQETVGLPMESIIGRSDSEVMSDPDAAARFRADDLSLLHGEPNISVKCSVRIASGQTIIMRVLKNLFVQADGSRLLLGMGFDITHEEEADLKLKAFLYQEQLTRSCLELVVHEKDESLFSKLLEKIASVTGAAEANIVLFDTPDSIPACLECWPSDSGIRETACHLPLDFPWIERQRQRQIVIVEDVMTDPSPEAVFNRPIFQRSNLRATVMTGLWLDNTFIGSLGLCYTDPHAFGDSDRQLIQSLAHIIELALGARRAREELERNNYQNRLILENITIPILLFSSDMRLIRVNKAARELTLNASEAFILSNPCYRSFCGHCTVPKDCQVKRVLLDGKIHSRDMTFKNRDMHMIAIPISIEGRLAFVLECGIDMTEFNQSQRKLIKAMEAAQAADRAKTTFLATMSHELRTPLNAVIGFSEILQHETMPPEQQADSLRAINLAGNALLSLINDVLDLSKIEADQLAFTPTSTDLKALFNEIEAMFALKISEKHLTFRLEGAETLPSLMLDATRIRQVLLNLVGNAIKFTHEGGITIRAVFTPASPTSRKGSLAISVIDTGIGIAPHRQAHIFEPFVQEHEIRGNRSYEGSGLGLTISNRLIQRMGGALTLESEPGKGSTFTFTLETETNPELPAPAAEESAKPLSGVTALLVDDVPMNLKVLEAMLKRLNVASVSATSAADALAILETTPIDLILTDLWMPEISGQELAETVRANPAWSRIPLFAVTADTEAAVNFNMAVFNDVLSKPVSLHTLTALLASVKHG